MAVIALVATTIPSILSLLLDRDEAPQERWEVMATVDELADAEVIYEPRWGVFLVHEPQGPLALYALSPHNPSGNERVLFCPTSGYFEEPQHGESFDRRGIYAAGPASRGLDRFDVRVRRDVIEVNVRVVFRGPDRGRFRPDPAGGPPCGDRGWQETDPGFWGPPTSLDQPV